MTRGSKQAETRVWGPDPLSSTSDHKCHASVLLDSLARAGPVASAPARGGWGRGGGGLAERAPRPVPEGLAWGLLSPRFQPLPVTPSFPSPAATCSCRSQPAPGSDLPVHSEPRPRQRTWSDAEKPSPVKSRCRRQRARHRSRARGRAAAAHGPEAPACTSPARAAPGARSRSRVQCFSTIV